MKAPRRVAGAAVGVVAKGARATGRATKTAALAVKDAAGTVVEKISEKMPFGDDEEGSKETTA
ncbi:MAG: hypothetical protein ABR599_05315 [Gemmatimonadota bacterium]